MGTTRLISFIRAMMFFFIIAFLIGCSGSSSTKPVVQTLSVSITSPSWNVTLVQGQSLDFQIQVTGGTKPYTYLWDFGGGANNSAKENPSPITFNATGTYTVKITITDSKNAAASASMVVTVQDKSGDNPPPVDYTTPADGATNVPLNVPVQVSFSNFIDISTVTTSTFMVSNGGNPVSGTMTLSGNYATFTPSAPLEYGTLYTARLTTGIKDILGNALLPSDYTWSFSTTGYTLDAVITSPSGNVIILEGQSVNFKGTATGGTAPYTYKWNFGGGIPYSTAQNPGDTTFSNRGTYPVVFRSFDANGHTSFASVAVTVYSTTAGDWSRISAGGGHTLALKTDGTLWVWGNNHYGQLGNNSNINRVTPVQAGGTWACIAAGYAHSLGIKQDGTLWAWGQNAYGQLGDGTNVDRNVPVQVGLDNTWAAVATGYLHCLAIKKDGTLWAWGFNKYGQLGDGTQVNKNAPVQVGYGPNWAAVAAGYGHSLAIKQDGTLWAWGHNSYGQLGDGTNIDNLTPVQVGTENNWANVAGGYDHSLGLKKDGVLEAWGNNDYGQLGDGTDVDRNAPAQVGTENNWFFVSAGWDHSLGIKTDGTLWAWGINPSGQLGDGTLVDKDTPVQLGSESNWAVVDGGNYYSGAIKTGGTLWMWGSNVSGQLGDGTLSNRDAPVQVK
jgi:alpha-tubulin suppressor-like RCC1 family protein